MTTEKAGLYVHVPFCVSKCPYCAFTSGTNLDALPDYLDALEREIEARADTALDADSIHLGGGTPSLLSPADVGRIIAALSRSFGIDPGAEITLEANPGTVSPDSLRGYRKKGVNRLTLGAQSFSPEDLAFLGRIHVPAETRAAFEAAREGGFDNLGIDLIYGLPGRTLSHWIEQMDEAVALGPEHISCYALSFEGGTPMDRRRLEGAFAPPGEEDAREAILETHRFLESRRFPFYEVSNFSLDGLHPSRHNLKYWSHVPYLGFGPSAHSFAPPVRRWNTDSLDAYLRSGRGGLAAGEGRETLTPSQRALEFVSLGLRTREGVDVRRLEDEFAPAFREINGPVIEDLKGKGLVSLEGSTLRLTREGLLLADRIPLEFEI